MYPVPLAKRIKLEGNFKDYGFDLISKKPSKNELMRWGITMPHGNNYITEEVYDIAVGYVKKYWQFDNYLQDLSLSPEGYFTAQDISPERISAVWLALAKHESGDREHSYIPRQFFTDIDVEISGKIKHFDIVPLFARSVVGSISAPNYMSAGCLAYGIGNISAYSDVISDYDTARRAAWDYKYNIELSVMAFSRKWYIAQSHDRGLPLDAAVIYYHGWDGKDETTAEYLSRNDIDDNGKELRSSKRYYDAVKALYDTNVGKSENKKESDETVKEEMLKEIEESKMDIKNELGKIGVRGGHAVTDNPLPLEYGYPAYVEGKYVHNLSQRMTDEFGWINLEPEEDKLKWSEIARRGRQAQCDTIFYNHTNFSLNAKGEPNSGTVVIIYPFENEEYKSLYEKMAEIIAKHMGLPNSETRIRMSTNYENKNYYSALHYGKKYGIRHPLIVEYGYHVDVAGREEERTAQILSAYREMMGIEEEKDTASIVLPNDGSYDLAGLRDKLKAVAEMISSLLDMMKN